MSALLRQHIDLALLVEPQSIRPQPTDDEIRSGWLKAALAQWRHFPDKPDLDQDEYRAKQLAKWRSAAISRNWQFVRGEVWDRDGGTCQVCQRPLEDDNYECGHIVDRVCNGSDRLDNLVAMCVLCNRLKPLHKTPAEYDEWKEGGGVWGDFARHLRDKA